MSKRRFITSAVFTFVVVLAFCVLTFQNPLSGGNIVKNGNSITNHLQQISATIKADNSSGSGVITTVGNTSYVWTAGHVVKAVRKERKLDEGKKRITFDDVEIVQEFVEDGRNVGNTRLFAEVIRYSDADFAEDLALLRIRKKNIFNFKTKFYLDNDIPEIGEKLFHVGSLLGQRGSNSLVDGIISQHGRLIDDKVYDQTNMAAFGGSSGGGVFLQNDGRYCGMIVRGHAPGFNYMVPIRRILSYARRVGVEFTLNPSIKPPKDDEFAKLPIEEK